jgi:nitrous oxide reductase accessory protein NosL
MVKTLTVTALAGAAGMGVSRAESPSTDGTPTQFIPKTPPDPDPLDGELEKYPRCPYCGMDRRKWHHSRHLIHYSDDLVDGLCSLHCAAVSLALNLDRVPKAIYGADFGSSAEPRPLVDVDQGPVTYLIGSGLPGTMTGRSKMAFADPVQAEAAREAHGGDLGDFDAALTAAYADMAKDTKLIRKRRAERRRRMQMRERQNADG